MAKKVNIPKEIIKEATEGLRKQIDSLYERKQRLTDLYTYIEHNKKYLPFDINHRQDLLDHINDIDDRVNNLELYINNN